MALSVMEINKCDPAWDRIVDEAKSSLIKEPLLSSLVHSSILHHRNLEQALSYRVAYKLSTAEMPEQMLREISDEAMRGDGEISSCARADLVAVTERDPACNSFIQPLLFFKGFQAIQAYRVGHWLWKAGRQDMALLLAQPEWSEAVHCGHPPRGGDGPVALCSTTRIRTGDRGDRRGRQRCIDAALGDARRQRCGRRLIDRPPKIASRAC